MPPFLILQRGPIIGQRYDLDAGQVTIGRGQDNDLVLNDVMVSRYHAVVRQEGTGVVVIDLGSANPVLVNNVPLEPGVPQRLQHRDVVVIGGAVFSFQNPTASQELPTASRGAAEPRTLVGSSLAGPLGAAAAPPVPESWATPAPPPAEQIPEQPSPAARSEAIPPPVQPELPPMTLAAPSRPDWSEAPTGDSRLNDSTDPGPPQTPGRHAGPGSTDDTPTVVRRPERDT